MSDIDMKGDAPVGAIVPFFGPYIENIAKNGWLICNGATLEQSAWPDLYAAIGQSFGYSDPKVDFCLPDLSGAFLRMLDAGSGRDAESKARTASGPNKSGAAGDAIGSFQQDATRMPPNASFTIKGRFDMGGNSTHDGCSDSKRIRFNDASGKIGFGGGDAESCPVNLNGIYLIKARANTASNPAVGSIPLGSAIAFPVKAPEQTPLDDFWRYCEGQTFIAAEGSTFYPLYGAIGTVNGGVKGVGDQVERFAIPDLRGLYIRGVGKSTLIPAERPRDTPRPDLSIPGNSGNDVGSYQDWATASPRGEKFQVAIQSYPFNSTGGYQAGAANAAKHTGDTGTFDVAGGNAETRPKTFAVDWYVRFRTNVSTGAEPLGSELPLGAVISTGSAAALGNWMPCEGQTLQIAEYEGLFKVIGTQFGGDGVATFCLPDMRGRFLRGCGPELKEPRPRGTPPAQAGAVQEDITGAPRNKFTVTLSNWPGGNTSDIISYGTGTKLLKLEGDKTVTASGGDVETRPANIYVLHLIKVRH